MYTFLYKTTIVIYFLNSVIQNVIKCKINNEVKLIFNN